MKKVKLILLSLFLAGFSSVKNIGAEMSGDAIARPINTETIIYHPSYTLQSETHIPNAIVAWDLNNVLFTTKFGAKEFLSGAYAVSSDTFQFLRNLKSLISLKNAINVEREKQGSSKIGWEHMPFVLLKSDEPNHQALGCFMQKAIMGPDKVDELVGHVMHELSQYHYKQVVLSNMHSANLALQLDGIKEVIENSNVIVKKEIYSTIYNVLSCDQACHLPRETNNWTYKPEQQAYEMCLKNYPDHKVTVFIDDKPENVYAAVKSGFSIGIIFKDALQLRTDLEAIGLLPELFCRPVTYQPAA